MTDHKLRGVDALQGSPNGVVAASSEWRSPARGRAFPRRQTTLGFFYPPSAITIGRREAPVERSSWHHGAEARGRSIWEGRKSREHEVTIRLLGRDPGREAGAARTPKPDAVAGGVRSVTWLNIASQDQ
jgi:hypothetical protein